MVSESGNRARRGQAFKFDEVRPEGELSDDVLRELDKLLPRDGGKLDLHGLSVPPVRVQSRPWLHGAKKGADSREDGAYRHAQRRRPRDARRRDVFARAYQVVEPADARVL